MTAFLAKGLIIRTNSPMLISPSPSRSPNANTMSNSVSEIFIAFFSSDLEIAPSPLASNFLKLSLMFDTDLNDMANLAIVDAALGSINEMNS